MKRYGDNLPSNRSEESDCQNGNDRYLAGNCAVRQDMVAFVMPTFVPNQNKKSKRNLFSLFNLRQERAKENNS